MMNGNGKMKNKLTSLLTVKNIAMLTPFIPLPGLAAKILSVARWTALNSI